LANIPTVELFGAMGRVDGKIALVTGAAQSLGRVIAEVLSTPGSIHILVNRAGIALQKRRPVSGFR